MSRHSRATSSRPRLKIWLWRRLWCSHVLCAPGCEFCLKRVEAPSLNGSRQYGMMRTIISCQTCSHALLTPCFGFAVSDLNSQKYSLIQRHLRPEHWCHPGNKIAAPRELKKGKDVISCCTGQDVFQSSTTRALDPRTHEFGWMVSGQETVLSWVLFP
jgi:hypothetical protein